MKSEDLICSDSIFSVYLLCDASYSVFAMILCSQCHVMPKLYYRMYTYILPKFVTTFVSWKVQNLSSYVTARNHIRAWPKLH